jgi:CRP-like cAMP-binding protein
MRVVLCRAFSRTRREDLPVSATYRRSDVIYSQGDGADSVFYVQAGSVELSVSSRGGKQGVVAILRSGEFFGDSALAGGPVRQEKATAGTTLASVHDDASLRRRSSRCPRDRATADTVP